MKYNFPFSPLNHLLEALALPYYKLVHYDGKLLLKCKTVKLFNS